MQNLTYLMKITMKNISLTLQFLSYEIFNLFMRSVQLFKSPYAFRKFFFHLEKC